MSFNNFTNLDFNDLRTQIKNYLRANAKFTDFDFEGSNFSVLIDLLAYNSYITAFNTNMVVNESFIDSATLRENVVSLARNIGYVPRSKRASRAKVSFSVSTPRDANGNLISKTVTLKAGVVALGAVENGNYIFSIPEDKTVVIDNDGFANFTDIDIFEGTFLTKSFTINDSQLNQKFLIPNASVDTSTIRVKVTNVVNEKYELYNNIFKVDKNSKLFLVQEVSDEKYEILFGDNILGKRPPSGSTILVSYIVTNGREGDGCTNFTFSGILIDNNQTEITNNISLITTTQVSENGDDIESIDSIKYLGPRVYASQYRAVTANDYRAIIPMVFPNVDTVSAYGGEELDPPQYGKVFISIKPRNGKFLSQISKNEIKRELKQYSIAGIQPEIIDLKYLYVEVETSVYYDKSSTTSVVNLQSRVLNTLKNYAKSSELNSFGGRFKFSKVSTLIDNTSTSITSNITKIKIRRDLQPELNKLANYEICFGNQFHVQKLIDGKGYNIKSTGFTIKDISDTLYLSDIPKTDDAGNIFFFKIVDNSPIVVLNNAGVVDYKKGEIKLNPVIITSSTNTNGIEIQAIPESNDVISLKDIYLELDTTTLKVNMLEDVITSGENTSATEYPVTSSYNNGNYIR
jgi:hypothetical protein